VAVLLGVTGAGCGRDAGADADAAPDRPHVVVTTSILGDVTRQLVGDQADVEVVMPIGADPHEFAPSARQAEAMQDADLLVVNGADFEQGMAGIIEGAAADGTPTFTLADHVALRHVDDSEHHDDVSTGGDGHDHEGDDPHVWTDPTNVAAAVTPLAAALQELDGVDVAAIEQRATQYEQELEDLDAEVVGILAPIPAARRVLVTNHEAMRYFAERYGFEVVGTVIPSMTTMASASAAGVEALAAVIEERDVPAIFGETTQPTQLADALADEVGGDVQVVELYTESLGEPGSGADTYVGMVRTDAELIVRALT
jgi:zinc/manganese transport system substrate-binding protein